MVSLGFSSPSRVESNHQSACAATNLVSTRGGSRPSTLLRTLPPTSSLSSIDVGTPSLELHPSAARPVEGGGRQGKVITHALEPLAWGPSSLHQSPITMASPAPRSSSPPRRRGGAQPPCLPRPYHTVPVGDVQSVDWWWLGRPHARSVRGRRPCHSSKSRGAKMSGKFQGRRSTPSSRLPDSERRGWSLGGLGWAGPGG